MNANLIAYQPDGRGETSDASVQFNSTYIIQLTINNRKFQFDYLGNLLSQTENQSCVNLNSHASCAQIIGSTCIPTDFIHNYPQHKSED